MTTELAVRTNGDIPEVSWTAEQVDLIKHTIAVGATHDELRLFLYQAKRTGLDPLARQIHFVKRKDKGTIQTAIDGYRLIADRTGKYAGNDDYLFDEGLSQYSHMATQRGNPTTATATVYKMCDGVKTAFTATAGWDEYFPGDAQGFMWKKMPYLMVGKCAEALALRKAFPAELSGVYTNEEMMQADSEPRRQSTAENPPPAEALAPNYGKYARHPLSSIPNEGLLDYLQGMKRSINDPKKVNFKAKNAAMLEAIEAELAKRESNQDTPDSQASTQGHPPEEPPQGAQGESGPAQPTMTLANIKQQFVLSEQTHEVAQIMNQWQDEKHLHTADENAEVMKAFEVAKRRLGKR